MKDSVEVENFEEAVTLSLQIFPVRVEVVAAGIDRVQLGLFLAFETKSARKDGGS